MAAAIVGRRAARNFGGAWDLYFNVSSLSRNIKEMSSDQKTQNSRSAGIVRSPPRENAAYC